MKDAIIYYYVFPKTVGRRETWTVAKKIQRKETKECYIYIYIFRR